MQRQITGVILAGGQSSRMGGSDKGLLLLNEKPLYQHVLSRLHSQVGHILISANRNAEKYQQSGYPVIADATPDFSGPLAGMLAGLTHARTKWVFFAPCDVPALPLDIVDRLWQQREESLAIYVKDGEQAHPTLSLMHIELINPLTRYLAQGDRKLMLFLQSIRSHAVMFNDVARSFSNLNTPADLLDWQKNHGDLPQ